MGGITAAFAAAAALFRRAFRTGRGLLNIAAKEQKQIESLCRLIGREDLVGNRRPADREDCKLNRHEFKMEVEEALARPSATDCLIKRFPPAPGVAREVAVVHVGLSPRRWRPGAQARHRPGSAPLPTAS
jgi:crotonobetainyl-CoA:carnitine CoA-transferase CaiB-like acyl-CoA transferase